MKTLLSRDCLAVGPVLALLSECGPIGVQIRDLFSSGRHSELLQYATVDPSGFTCWQEYMKAYQAVSLLRKYPGLTTGINTARVAMEKFEVSENQCRTTNERFAHVRTFDFARRSILELARNEVKRTLRDFSWDSTLPYLSFSGGATFATKRKFGHPWYKFGDLTPTVTGEALALTSALIRSSPFMASIWMVNGVNPKVCLGSRIETVPKDSRSDRVIAVEPLWNMYLQKGIGGLMRARLKQSNCNLNDQSINQRLALLGSVSNRLATIDLASASDTISRGLVEFLLPESWLVAMKSCRSTQSLTKGGKWIFLQKFSSMGNGYTFELESCIFLALTRAVCRFLDVADSDVSVYGDDIICPVEAVGLLKETLEFCGFSMNLEKSFIEGPFRESCGKHYFLGRDVTPFYLKKEVKTPEESIWLCNSIKRLAFRLQGLDYGLYGGLRKAWEQSYAQVDPRYRGYSVPEGVGDGGILRDWDEVSPKPRPIQGWVEGFETKILLRKYDKFKARNWPCLVWRLSELERRDAASSAMVEFTHHTHLPFDDAGAKPLVSPSSRVAWTDLPSWDWSLSPGAYRSLIANDYVYAPWWKPWCVDVLVSEYRLKVLAKQKCDDGISLEISSPSGKYKLGSAKIQVRQWTNLGPWCG